MNRNLFLSAQSLSAGKGGICRVARLMLKVLCEELHSNSIKLQSLSLSDFAGIKDIMIPVKLMKGSRLRYFYEVQKASIYSTHFIYDFVGMARAHCLIPFFRKPFMTWIHGVEVWEKARKDRIRWAKRADLLLSNSNYTRMRAENHHGYFNNIKLCWLGTENDNFPDISKANNGPPKVLIVGRIDEELYKGHLELIDCWEKVVSSISDAELIIVGEGAAQNAIKERTTRSPVCNKIKIYGFMPEGIMGKVWGEATAFAMPSRGEGFGIVYIEAMRHGLPVVASIHDAAQEINIEGKTGFNVNLDKPDELPERIIHLLKNRDQALSMGKMGQEHWMKHFSYSAFKNRFVPILTDFIN